jgi:hypothetical protein
MPTPNDLRAQAEQLLAKATELETPLTQADVSRMYKAREYDQITQARQDGRLDNLLNPTEGA